MEVRHIATTCAGGLLFNKFLANVNSRSRSLYAIARPSVCRLSVVCLSSVVCNVRAPYSGGSDFRQYFYDVRYLGYPCTDIHWKFHGDRPRGTPPTGELNTRSSQDIAISDLSTAIFRKRCKIGGKLLLITNRKSYMSFRSVPKSVTLNDLERRNGVILRYFSQFG